jgi:hypothetical protein
LQCVKAAEVQPTAFFPSPLFSPSVTFIHSIEANTSIFCR